MFTDIVRSTELIEAIGDDAWADLLRWHDNALRSLFAAHGGEEIHHAGDGFFVAFTDPSAAVNCAVAVQRSLYDHRRAHGFAPKVRIGLHAADATRDSSGYQGKGVHEAARISAQAEGGEILASAKTLAGTALRFPASVARLVELRSISEPIELVAIDWRA
jgi:class 3 adenylate cyclase